MNIKVKFINPESKNAKMRQISHVTSRVNCLVSIVTKAYFLSGCVDFSSLWIRLIFYDQFIQIQHEKIIVKIFKRTF